MRSDLLVYREYVNHCRALPEYKRIKTGKTGYVMSKYVTVLY